MNEMNVLQPRYDTLVMDFYQAIKRHKANPPASEVSTKCWLDVIEIADNLDFAIEHSHNGKIDPKGYELIQRKVTSLKENYLK